MHNEHPELIKDQYWDQILPTLPYANENEVKREEPPEPSTAKFDVKPDAVSNMVRFNLNKLLFLHLLLLSDNNLQV